MQERKEVTCFQIPHSSKSMFVKKIRSKKRWMNQYLTYVVLATSCAVFVRLAGQGVKCRLWTLQQGGNQRGSGCCGGTKGVLLLHSCAFPGGAGSRRKLEQWLSLHSVLLCWVTTYNLPKGFRKGITKETNLFIYPSPLKQVNVSICSLDQEYIELNQCS